MPLARAAAYCSSLLKSEFQPPTWLSREATVNELAEPFDITLQAVSRHLKVLETAGLISRGREAQWRPCKLETARLQEVDGWLARYRRFWEGSFDKMRAYLEEITKGDDNGSKN